jgi:hypothetical protein
VQEAFRPVEQIAGIHHERGLKDALVGDETKLRFFVEVRDQRLAIGNARERQVDR